MEIRFCKDCLHFKENMIGTKAFHKCKNPEVIVHDVVTGEQIFPYCDAEREDFGPLTTCGPGGKYWVSRENPSTKQSAPPSSFWTRLKEGFKSVLMTIAPPVSGM